LDIHRTYNYCTVHNLLSENWKNKDIFVLVKLLSHWSK
jgi:hypothetical protein